MDEQSNQPNEPGQPYSTQPPGTQHPLTPDLQYAPLPTYPPSLQNSQQPTFPPVDAPPPTYPPQSYAASPYYPLPAYPLPPIGTPVGPRLSNSRSIWLWLAGVGIVDISLIIVFVVTLATFGGQSSLGNSPNFTRTNTPPVPATVTPYQAVIPGPGCDTHGGIWGQPLNATVKCLHQTGKMLMKHGPNFPDFGLVNFYGYSDQTLPPDVEVSVQIDGLTAGCAGVLTRGHDIPGYVFEICTDGSWFIYGYSPSDGTGSTLLAGSITTSRIYTLIASSSGPKETLTVNNTEVGSVVDNTTLQGGYVGLLVDDTVSANSATFSHFVLT
jgi:hypothetical protein